MALFWRHHHDRLGARGMVEVYWQPLDPDRYGPDPKPTLAQGGYQIIAQILAEPLRRAFREHLDSHRCHERGGFGTCADAMALFRMLPPAAQVLLA